MDEATCRFLLDLAVFFGLLPITIAIINRKHADRNQRILLYLILVSFFTDLLGYITLYIFQTTNNLYLTHIYILVEFLLFGMIYQKELADIIRPKYFNILVISFVLFAITNSIFFEPISQFNSISRAVSNLLLIIFSLAYFYKLLRDTKIRKLESVPMFWIATGSLIYFSASFFIFIFSNYFMPSIKLSFTFWGIHALLNIFLMLFYTIALWIKPPKVVD